MGTAESQLMQTPDPTPDLTPEPELAPTPTPMPAPKPASTPDPDTIMISVTVWQPGGPYPSFQLPFRRSDLATGLDLRYRGAQHLGINILNAISVWFKGPTGVSHAVYNSTPLDEKRVYDLTLADRSQGISLDQKMPCEVPGSLTREDCAHLAQRYGYNPGTLTVGLLILQHQISRTPTSYEPLRYNLELDHERIEDYKVDATATFAEFKAGIIHRLEVEQKITSDHVEKIKLCRREHYGGFFATNDNDPSFTRDRLTAEHDPRAPATTEWDHLPVLNILRDGHVLLFEIYVREPGSLFVRCRHGADLRRLCLATEGNIRTLKEQWILAMRDSHTELDPLTPGTQIDPRRVVIRRGGDQGPPMNDDDPIGDLVNDATVTVTILDTVPPTAYTDTELRALVDDTVQGGLLAYRSGFLDQGPRLLRDHVHDMEIVLTQNGDQDVVHTRLVLSALMLLGADEGSLMELHLRNRTKFLGATLRLDLTTDPFDRHGQDTNVKACDALVDFCYTHRFPTEMLTHKDQLDCLHTWADYMGFHTLRNHLGTLAHDPVLEESRRRKI